jgi:hypothetical protein
MRPNLLALAGAAFFVGVGVALPHEAATPVRTSSAADSSEVIAPRHPLPVPASLRIARAVLRGVGIENTTRAARVQTALDALTARVREQSHPRALKMAFEAYYGFRAAHPNEVRKPYLYFVDYGLDSHTPRGYVFDMDALQVVDGPFTVAHGRGSSTSQYGVPTRFSNASGSAATSLGLYLTKSTYDFHGHAGGQAYSAVGMRLVGVSEGFNDNAFARRVVAHGAPYVTPSKAGRSEGCPAMEPTRAQRLLPKLADGGMVFLFAPDQDWMARDPWIVASAD